MASNVYASAVGVQLTYGLDTDATGATCTLEATDPAGTVHTHALTVGTVPFEEGGQTLYHPGRWVYFLQAGGDFAILGQWGGRVRVNPSAGGSFPSDPFTFTVGA